MSDCRFIPDLSHSKSEDADSRRSVGNLLTLLLLMVVALAFLTVFWAYQISRAPSGDCAYDLGGCHASIPPAEVNNTFQFQP